MVKPSLQAQGLLRVLLFQLTLSSHLALPPPPLSLSLPYHECLLDQVINERDVLGSTLIRRNDELSLVYERLKIQQSTLSKGMLRYQYGIQHALYSLGQRN